MLAPQAEIAAERREAREAGERLGGSVDGAVERIALDGCGEEDDEPEADRDPAGEAPRIRAPEAEVVEQVAGIAGDAGPEARGDAAGSAASTRSGVATATPTSVKATHQPALSFLSSNASTPSATIVTRPKTSATPVRRLITVSSALGRTGSRLRRTRTSASEPGDERDLRRDDHGHERELRRGAATCRAAGARRTQAPTNETA